MTDRTTAEKIVAAALKARTNSYAPYSDFHVGAALLCDDGSIYTGCNIESASYPCGICAERTAAAKAISDGRRNFSAIAVAGSSDELCTPCGLCRQFLYEFAPDLEVICANANGEYEIHILSELLPHGFGGNSMK